jgi:hypothetical protein
MIRVPALASVVSALGLLGAGFYGLDSMASSISRWGTMVGADGTDNVVAYCGAYDGIVRVGGIDQVTTRFKTFKSDGTATNLTATNDSTLQQARIHCYSGTSPNTSATVRLGSWSSDATQQQSTATCTSTKTHGFYPECAMWSTGNLTYLYRGTACGNGVASVSNSQLMGQQTGTYPIVYEDQNGNLAQTLYNDTVAQAKITGTDLGNIYYSKGKMYFAFGDTNGSSAIRHNTIAWASFFPAMFGVPFGGWVGLSGGEAPQVINTLPGTIEPGGAIPSGGWAITEGADTYHYLWTMSVTGWNPVLSITHGSIAYSKNDALPWTRLDQSFAGTCSGVCWSANSNFTNVGIYHDIVGNPTLGSGYIYIFGFKANGNMGDSTSGVKLARVKAKHSEITDITKYRYWNTTNGWVTAESSASTIVSTSHHVRELSVVYNSHTNRYLMMFLNAQPACAGGLEVLQASALTGPWTAVTGASDTWASNVLPRICGMYAPMAHDRYQTDTGTSLQYLLSEFGPNQSIYNVGMWRYTVNQTALSNCAETPLPVH